MVSRRTRKRKSGEEVESRQYTITIPSKIVEAFEWDEATNLEITIEGKGILRVRETK